MVTKAFKMKIYKTVKKLAAAVAYKAQTIATTGKIEGSLGDMKKVLRVTFPSKKTPGGETRNDENSDKKGC